MEKTKTTIPNMGSIHNDIKNVLTMFNCKDYHKSTHKEQLVEVLTKLIDTMAIDPIELLKLNVEDYKDDIVIMNTTFNTVYRIENKEDTPFEYISNVPNHIIVYPTRKANPKWDYYTVEEFYIDVMAKPLNSFRIINVKDISTFYTLLYLKQLVSSYIPNTVLFTKNRVTDYNNYYEIFNEVRNRITEVKNDVDYNTYRLNFIGPNIYGA